MKISTIETTSQETKCDVMMDFMIISTRSNKRGIIEIYPKFIIKKSSDLMIRGGDFYAIWIEERGLPEKAH